jgi:hypothetical protein
MRHPLFRFRLPGAELCGPAATLHAVILDKRSEYASANEWRDLYEVFSSILAPNVRFELNQYFSLFPQNLVGKNF